MTQRHGAEPPAVAPLIGTIRRVALASTLAQVIGQAVTLVQTIVLARLLSPSDVGVFAAGTDRKSVV